MSIRHHLPFYKNIRDRKNLNYHFLFLKKMAAKIRRSYQKLTNAGSFSALLSQARRGLDTTCLSFFVIATFCFYKKKYCSSSLIFTSPLFWRRTCFFLSTNKYGKTFFAWDSTTMTVVWYAPPRDGMAIVFFVRATAKKRSPFFPRGGRGSPPPTRYSVFTFIPLPFCSKKKDRGHKKTSEACGRWDSVC